MATALAPILLGVALNGCGGFVPVAIEVTLPEGFYDSWREKGFCWSESGGISNVHEGGFMSAPMPICKRSDVVMHTHPDWAERCANFVDFSAWRAYHLRYGNELFGVCGTDWSTVYVVEQ